MPHKWQIWEQSAQPGMYKVPKAGVGSQLVQKLGGWCCLLLPPAALGDHGRGVPCEDRPRSVHAPHGCLQCRTQLSLPAKLAAPLGKWVQEREENTGQAEEKGIKGEKQLGSKQGWRRRCSNRYHSPVRPSQTSLTRTVARGKPCQSRGKMWGGDSSR